jgi:hypothetical protein
VNFTTKYGSVSVGVWLLEFNEKPVKRIRLRSERQGLVINGQPFSASLDIESDNSQWKIYQPLHTTLPDEFHKEVEEEIFNSFKEFYKTNYLEVNLLYKEQLDYSIDRMDRDILKAKERISAFVKALDEIHAHKLVLAKELWREFGK